ncbi:Bromodomain-containing protein [Earliella scabrosa]|nr:Bromodomain-containing protein [Earliella scabrosa]
MYPSHPRPGRKLPLHTRFPHQIPVLGVRVCLVQRVLDEHGRVEIRAPISSTHTVSPLPTSPRLYLLSLSHAARPYTVHDALSTNLNGVHLDSVSAPDSPAVDSVATPVNNSVVLDIKIDVDYTGDSDNQVARRTVSLTDKCTSCPSPPRSLPPYRQLSRWANTVSACRWSVQLKDASPFIQPVDPIALGIPHYPSIIKRPMDFSTIERKLNASNPSKPDPNPANPRYHTAEQLTLNGPDHPVTQMGKRVEAVFDKQIKPMPPPEEPKAPAPKKVASPPPPPPAPPKKQVRRASTNVPVIRRNDESAVAGRPKREIHPPPPKDLPYAEAPRKPRKAKAPKNAAIAEQLKFCEKVWKDLHQKQHYSIAHPFYEPVDPLRMGIPEYSKKKLDAGKYPTPEKSRDDFRLMIKNCLLFNPPGNPIHEAGKALQLLFDEKWKNMPVPRSHDPSEDEDDEDEDTSDDERARMEGMIADMENQIANMKASLKRNGKDKHQPKKEKEKREKLTPPSAPKQSKAPPAPKGKKSKKPVTDDDVLTFEQKKDLGDTISKLNGGKLEKVIQIIHEGVPEIRQHEEIELEIDQLPAAVLTKLYNFVIRPLKSPVKRPRTGKGTGIRGLKRKSMDEDVETKKIRALKEELKSFEQGGQSSSDESSASDSE